MPLLGSLRMVRTHVHLDHAILVGVEDGNLNMQHAWSGFNFAQGIILPVSVVAKLAEVLGHFDHVHTIDCAELMLVSYTMLVLVVLFQVRNVS